MYCPVESGMAVTAVVPQGRLGVWQLKNMDLRLPDSDVVSKVNSVPLLQPEEDGDYTINSW